MADNPHAGHRERLKREFIAGGFEGWPQEKVLEFALFFANARSDVKPLAKRLLARFGSIWGVTNAPLDQLTAVTGVGDHCAALLKMIGELHGFVGDQRKTEGRLDTLAAQIDMLKPRFAGLKHESMFLLCLDSQKRCLGIREVAKGTTRQVSVNLKTVTRHAVSSAADSVILAHNHLCGNPTPSASDHATTSSIRTALAQVDVVLLDHIIFTDTDALSMAGAYPNLDL
ncbi:UPF0758 protein [Clostridia bacterium]|nr:UPF0758 protein [Clostridia bacterium]